MYEMKPEYYTGIAQIDEEHKKLFEIADEAYELYKNDITNKCNCFLNGSCTQDRLISNDIIDSKSQINVMQGIVLANYLKRICAI